MPFKVALYCGICTAVFGYREGGGSGEFDSCDPAATLTLTRIHPIILTQFTRVLDILDHVIGVFHIECLRPTIELQFHCLVRGKHPVVLVAHVLFQGFCLARID